MMANIKPYGVYALINEAGCIIAISSDAFVSDLTGWIEIDSGYGDRYHHAQGNYFPQSIMDERGIWRYKLKDGKPEERTQEEMDADYSEPTRQPTQEERISALETRLAEYEAAYAEGVQDA